MPLTRIHILLGGLGVGKTTALQSILSQKPSDEIWGVVMNEFGPQGVDQWLLPQGAAFPQITVSGGCICCSPGASLVQTVQHLVDTYQPQRLFIEPSGWAHPAELRDQLKQAVWTTPMALGSICGLIDLLDWSTGRWLEHQAFWDMVHSSDVLIATKPDLISEDILDDWFSWAEEIYPPKIRWEVMRAKVFSIDWLAGEQILPHETEEKGSKEFIKPAGAFVGSRVQQVPGGWSGSWIFPPDRCFDPIKLDAFLTSRMGASRIKGIFQLPGQALVWQWVRGQSSQEWVMYDRDSRLEVLALDPLDWAHWEQGLVDCFIP